MACWLGFTFARIACKDGARSCGSKRHGSEPTSWQHRTGSANRKWKKSERQGMGEGKKEKGVKNKKRKGCGQILHLSNWTCVLHGKIQNLDGWIPVNSCSISISSLLTTSFSPATKHCQLFDQEPSPLTHSALCLPFVNLLGSFLNAIIQRSISLRFQGSRGRL